MDFFSAVLPNEEAKILTTIKPKKAGVRKIIVGFDSKELSDLAAEAVVNISK